MLLDPSDPLPRGFSPSTFMMQAKLNGIRNVEGENPLGKGGAAYCLGRRSDWSFSTH